MLDPVTQPHEYVDFGHVHHLCVCVVAWCVYENAYMVQIMVYATNMPATERRMCVLGHVCVSVCVCVCLSVS